MPVTNVIRIKPFKDKKEETLDWMAKMAAKASEMERYIKTEIPETNRRIAEKEFLTILQFEGREHLKKWAGNDDMKEQIEWVKGNLAGINDTDVSENMGFWQENKNAATLADFVIMPLLVKNCSGF